MDLFGREIKKTFKEIGVFTGKVVDYHKSTGYRVQYEDGDSEDLTHKELVRSAPPSNQKCCAYLPIRTPRRCRSQLKWLTKPTAAAAIPPPAAQQSMMSKRKDVSVTLDQYIKNARNGARKKRKHTELKRTGVLEVGSACDRRSLPPRPLPLP